MIELTASPLLDLIVALLLLLNSIQALEDVILIYCLFSAFARSKHISTSVACVTTGATWLSLRSFSVAATVLFVRHLADPENAFFILYVICNLASCIVRQGIATTAYFLRRVENASGPGRMSEERRKTDLSLRHNARQTTMVLMPCYLEDPDLVLASITSVAKSEYTRGTIHIFLGLDGPQNIDIFSQLVESFNAKVNSKHPFPCAEASLGAARLTMCVFEHGDKTQCQAQTMLFIKENHPEYFTRTTYTPLLMMDSDTILGSNTLHHLVDRLSLDSPTKHARDRPAALTCIQGISGSQSSLLCAIQEGEQIFQGILVEAVNASMGNCTCLYGPVALFRLDALLAIWDDFTQIRDTQTSSLFEYWRYVYGEDRHLTQLVSGKSGAFSADIVEGDIFRTKGASPLGRLITQRRRWFLGYIATEAAALCDSESWSTVPYVQLYRLLLRPMAYADLVMIMISVAIVLIRPEDSLLVWVPWTVALLFASNWLMLLGVAPMRKSVATYLYPLVVVLAPLVQATAIIWAVLTLRRRKW